MNLKNMITRLTSNYSKLKDSNIYKLFSMVASQSEELKETFEKISSWQGIENASGSTLDMIGEDVRAVRLGLADEEYRALLRFKISLDKGMTDINSINNAMKSITKDNYIRLYEGYNEYNEPASIKAMLKKYNENIPYEKMDTLLSAGVNLYITAETETKSKLYVASTTLSGEILTVFPYNLKEISVSGKVEIASGYNTSYEITQIGPKI